MRHRSWVFVLLVVSLMVLLATGCSREDAPPEDASLDEPSPQVAEIGSPDAAIDSEVAAFINEIPVPHDDFERGKQQLLSRYQQLYAQMGLQTSELLGGAEGRLFELRIEEEALEMATARLLIAEELDRQDAAVSDEAVEAVFQTQYSQFLSSAGMSEEELEQAFATGNLGGLETGGLSYDQFVASTRQTVREELELQAIRQLVAGDIDHSETTLAAYYEEHLVEYAVHEKVRASQILVSTRDMAEQALAVLDAGGKFSELVEEISIDTNTSKKGGDLGWIERGDTVAPFEEAAFSTPVGEVSDIIRTEFGFHILMVTDYQPAEQPAFQDVRERVTNDYDIAVTAQRFDEWYAAERAKAVIVIQDPMLAAFRKLKGDTDLGLEAFLSLRDGDQVDDPYLGFIIGTIYEAKMSEAESAKSTLQAYMTRTPSQEAELVALETTINANRNKAITAYYEALSNFEEHPEIEARIERLNPGF